MRSMVEGACGVAASREADAHPTAFACEQGGPRGRVKMQRIVNQALG